MRSLLLAISLASLLAAAQAPKEKIVVLGIEGDWWDSDGKALGFASVVTDCVLGQKGTLQIAEAKDKAQTFVPEKMAAKCPSPCGARPPRVPESARCAKVDLQASQPGSEPSWWARALDRLVRSPQVYIVAAARGLEEEPQEAVLPLAGSEVDLASSMQPVASGVYTVLLEPLDHGAGGKLTGKVSWTPGRPAKLPFPKISPGLYRLSIAVEGGDSEGSESWVLVSSAAHYEVDAKEFHEAVDVTHSWGDRVDASGKRAMLRACLRSLADRNVSK